MNPIYLTGGKILNILQRRKLLEVAISAMHIKNVTKSERKWYINKEFLYTESSKVSHP